MARASTIARRADPLVFMQLATWTEEAEDGWTSWWGRR
jgi:hypothetical protein